MCNVATHVDISLNPHIKNAPHVTINLSPIRYLSPQSFIRVYRVFHKLTEPCNLFLTGTGYVFVRFVKVSANLWRRYIYNDFLIGLGLAKTRITHDNVIKWKYFPRYWPFVRGIQPIYEGVTYITTFPLVWALLRKGLPMMTSSNGTIFRVTGHFPAQRPVTRRFDVFFDLRLNKRVNWEPLRPLWRHYNANGSGSYIPYLSGSYVTNRNHFNQHSAHELVITSYHLLRDLITHSRTKFNDLAKLSWASMNYPIPQKTLENDYLSMPKSQICNVY